MENQPSSESSQRYHNSSWSFSIVMCNARQWSGWLLAVVLASVTWPKFAKWANPYLNEVVQLDEYVKNRDVWRCPSAKVQGGANFILPGPDWLGYLKTTEGQWGDGMPIEGPFCITAWPPGWGGDVTDSIFQQKVAGTMTGGKWPPTAGASANRAFAMSIGLQNAYQQPGEGGVHGGIKLVEVADRDKNSV